MIDILIKDILPILVIMALGWALGHAKFFDKDQQQGLNKFVLDLALPAALFVSIVQASRAMLASDLTLTLLSIFGITGLFMLSFLLCKVLFHHTTQEAAVCALIAGSPTIGFLGFAVLDPIYGDNGTTNLVIGIVSIVVNAITIPLGLYLINRGQNKTKAALAGSTATASAKVTTTSSASSTASEKTAAAANAIAKAATATATTAAATAASPGASKGKADELKIHELVSEVESKLPGNENKEIDLSRSGISTLHKHGIKNPNLAAFIHALEKPVAAAPLLAVLWVLLGLPWADQLNPCFDLIAKANSGVAVFAAGLALSTVKVGINLEVLWNSAYRLILMPLVLAVVALLLGMGSDPSKASMFVMAVALPPAFSGIIISARYNIYVKEGANSVAVSTILFAVTCILWIIVMPYLANLIH